MTGRGAKQAAHAMARWRPLHLIGLGALAAAAVLVDNLPSGDKAGAVRELRLTVADAVVEASSGGARASFAAESLDVGPRIATAEMTAGSMSQDGATRNFEADRVSNDLFRGRVELSGDVRIWQGDEEIRTNWAHLGRDGSLRGTAATIRADGLVVTADGFRTDAEGNLELEGNVWASIGN